MSMPYQYWRSEVWERCLCQDSASKDSSPALRFSCRQGDGVVYQQHWCQCRSQCPATMNRHIQRRCGKTSTPQYEGGEMSLQVEPLGPRLGLGLFQESHREERRWDGDTATPVEDDKQGYTIKDLCSWRRATTVPTS